MTRMLYLSNRPTRATLVAFPSRSVVLFVQDRRPVTSEPRLCHKRLSLLLPSSSFRSH